LKLKVILAIAFFLLIISILFIGTVSAIDRTVTSGTTFDDINSTISISNNNDRILLGNNTYTTNGNQIHVGNKTGLIIEGQSDSQRAVLNAGHQNRIFVVDENSTVTFRYIDFLNGDCGNTSGAAIRTHNTIIVENCSFRNNYGESGGAIFIFPEAEHCFIINSSFINNEGRYIGDDEWVEGGAIDSHGNYTTIIDCFFQGNTALSVGGAVNFATNTMGQKLISSVFINNHAPRGGAVRVGVSDVLVENCTFTNNYANESHGGAIFLGDSEVTIKDCIFTNNRAVSNGGAIYASASSTLLNIINGSFNGNQGVNGGAIYAISQLSVKNSSFISNRASGVNAGGVYASNAILIENSNFTSNGGSGLVLIGVGTNIFNNNFTSNSGYGIRATDLRNAVINRNTFRNNGGTALYIVGNGNRVIFNSFVSNGLGIRIDGSNNNISNNTIDGNLAQGIYLVGNNNYIGFNDIKNNKRNAIWVKGSSVVIERNNITKNSIKGFSTIYINGNNAKVRNNNIFSNRYRGVEIIGNGATVLNNVFKNNVNAQVLIKGNTAQIKSNSISGGTAYGIYLTGNSANITSNTVNSNGLDGVYVVGTKAIIKSNILNNNGRGLYLKGNSCNVSSNTINNNVKNGIRGIGNKNLFNSNKLNSNSIKGKFCTIYFEGKQNTYKNNNLSNNGYHGLHMLGNTNTVYKNYCDNNKDTHIIVQGSSNKVSENKGYNGKNNGLHIIGSNNKVSKNIMNKNKNGIAIRGFSNQLNNNFIQSNSKIGVHVNGSKNSLVQNVIRSNNIGIYHLNGKNNKYNHNNIVNKQYNLNLKKGSVNADFNWWGKNKIVKVKNVKVSKHVVAYLIAPNMLELKKKHNFHVKFHDNKNKKLKLSIPSLKLNSSFYNGDNKLFGKNHIVSKNIGEKTSFSISKNGVYSLRAQIDSQLLYKNYFMLYGKKGYSSDSKKFSKYFATSFLKTSNKILSQFYKNSNINKKGTGFDVWKWLNSPIHPNAKFPYFDEIGKLPGGKILQDGIDFFLGTEGGAITPLTIVFAIVSFIPGGAVGTRLSKGILKISPKLAKLVPKVSLLFKKIAQSKIGQALSKVGSFINKNLNKVLDIFEVLASPNKLVAYTGKFLFGKSGVVTKFKNLPIVKKLADTSVGKFFISAKNKSVEAYNKFMKLSGLVSLPSNVNKIITNANNLRKLPDKKPIINFKGDNIVETKIYNALNKTTNGKKVINYLKKKYL